MGRDSVARRGIKLFYGAKIHKWYFTEATAIVSWYKVVVPGMKMELWSERQ